MKKVLIMLMLLAILTPILGTFALANNTKLVALTFDDGPSRTHTAPLLDGLAKRNVRASFFLVGTSIEKNPTLVGRALDEGHQLCNHSYSHPWFSKMTGSQISSEISACNSLLSEISGQSNHLLRVPYGAITKTVRQTAKTPLIQWSVDPTNGRADATEEGMYANFIKTVRDGSIILLHDTSKKNLNVALRAIDTLLAQGYEFVTVSELFRLRGISPQNGTEYFNVPQSAKETQYDEAKLSEHWAADYIDFVTDKKIMEGDEWGFQPNAYMSRAMAVTIMWRMAGSPPIIPKNPLSEDSTIPVTTETEAPASPPVSPPACPFTDVPHDSWYSEAVSWAASNNYVQGVSATLFAPNGSITKEQFYTILARYDSDVLSAASQSVPDAACSYRDDVHISTWAKDSVMAFRSRGFKSKNDPQIFRPLDFITRAEAAELISFIAADK